MEDYRSKSYGDGRMQIQSYNGGSQSSRASYGGDGRMQIQSYNGGGGSQSSRASYGSSYDHRSYSYSASSMPQQPPVEPKLKKGKSSGSNSKIWNFNDPELQRKKRVASYKVYSVEGKLKGSFRKNWRWLKDRYSQVVYGWW